MAISIVQGKRVPIHLWAPVHEVQSEALDQLKRVAALPWAFKRVAVMPDVHAGKGCTVGSVIALKDAISPAAVGVDIGCGMSAIKTNLTAEDMPDNLQALYDAIEMTIPTGFNSHATPAMKQDGGLFKEFKDLTPEVQDKLGTATNQCGTLGGGNHFIELCFDGELNVWLMLHSGSRNIGKCLAEVHIAKAKKLAHNAELPDKELAVFLAKTKEMAEYRRDLFWAQRYAALNREVMLDLLKGTLREHFPNVTFGERISCHHNYVAEETYDGEEVLVTRKGAINAGLGVMGIIPGSMGDKSHIVRGKGNEESFNSASHGAGRVLSRSQAKKKITVDRLIETTQGVMCRKDVSVIDEAPDSYKRIDEVMANQTDLVEIVYELKQFLNVKGQEKKKGEHGE